MADLLIIDLYSTFNGKSQCPIRYPPHLEQTTPTGARIRLPAALNRVDIKTVNYEIGIDTQQGVMLVKFSGILTQTGLIRHYLETTELLESHRVQCSIVDLLKVVPSPLSSKAITSLSRNEPLCISAKPRVFVANGRASIELWRSFISTNRNPTRTRLAGSLSEALELLGLAPLLLDVTRRSEEKRVEVGLLARTQETALPRSLEN